MDAMSVAKANREKDELEGYFDRKLKYIRSTGDMVLDHIDRVDFSTQLIEIEGIVDAMKAQTPDKNVYILPMLEEHVAKLRKAWNDAEQRYRDYINRGYEQM